MEIDKKIDSGSIFKVKKFKYNHNCTEIEFTEKCDDLTIDALIEVLLDNYTPHPNQKWDVKIRNTLTVLRLSIFCSIV